MANSASINISFPQDFLLPTVSLDDVPNVKIWSARFFVKQLARLWGIGVPARFPNRLVFVSLIDAILGEIISAADALGKELENEMKSKDIRGWKYEIRGPLDDAKSDDRWLARVCRLRNQGLHGSYMPEQIHLNVPDVTDLRLIEYEHGIVVDKPLPEDLAAVIEKMGDLVETSRRLVKESLQEKSSARDPLPNIADWFVGIS